MSGMSESEQPGATGPQGGDAAERSDIPTARSAEVGGSGADSRPIFEVAEDRCPKCGEVLPHDAVVCMKCGYDQRANRVREIETGVVEVPESVESPKAGKADFVVPGKLTPKTLGIAGAVLTVAAMVAAGIFGPNQTFLLVVGGVLLTLYTIAVNTATGVAAVAVAARLNSQPFGALNYALARMFAAFALFQAVMRARPSLGYSLLTTGIPFVVGAALYFGAIMILFKKDRRTTAVIAIAHFILWVLLQLGGELARWVSVSTPTGTAGGA